jgi:hypothetical protein
MKASEINAARSPNGGWTRETLAGWGIPWPPPRGWRRKLLRETDQASDHARECNLTCPNYDGAMADLHGALTVLIRRINGEADLASAAEWVRKNYPKRAAEVRCP